MADALSSNSDKAPAARRQSKDPPGSYRSRPSKDGGGGFHSVPDDVSVELNVWRQGENQRLAASAVERLEKMRSGIAEWDESKKESKEESTKTLTGGKVDVCVLTSGNDEAPNNSINSKIKEEDIPIKVNDDPSRNNDTEIDVDDLISVAAFSGNQSQSKATSCTREITDVDIDVDDLVALAEIDVDDWAAVFEQSIRDDEDNRRKNVNTTNDKISGTDDIMTAAKKEVEEGSTLSAPVAIFNLLREEPDIKQTNVDLECTQSDLQARESRDEADVAEAAGKVSQSSSSQKEKDIDARDNRATPDYYVPGALLAQSIMQNAFSDTLRQELRKQAHATNVAKAEGEGEMKAEGIVPAAGYNIGSLDKLGSIRSGVKALVIQKLRLGGDHSSTGQAQQELLSYLEEAGMSVMDVVSLALIGKLSLDEIQFAFSSNGLDDVDNKNDGEEGAEEENQKDPNGDEEADGGDKDTAEDASDIER